MRETLIKAALAAGLICSTQSAAAQGVRFGGSLDQTFEFDKNNNLGGGGVDFDSITSLGINLSSETETSSLRASTGAALTFGNNGQSLGVTRPKLRFSYNTRTKDVRYNGNLSYSKNPAAVDVTQPDLSVLRFTGDQTTISGGVGAAFSLRQGTSLALNAGVTQIDFDPASVGLVPSSNYTVSASLGYQLNNNTSYGFNVGLGWFDAENVQNTQSLSLDLGANLSHQRNANTTIDSNIGLAIVDTTETFSGVETSAFSVSLLFGAGLTQALPDGELNITLDQSVVPSASGNLVVGTTLGGSYTKAINQDVSYGIDAILRRQKAVGGGAATSFINISPSYSRQLTRDVGATASYYIQRDNTGSTAQGVSISLNRAFDFPLQ